MRCRRVALRREPRAARRRRGVGVRRLAGARRRDQRERPASLRRGRGRRPPAPTTDAGELPHCDFGIVATKAMHTTSAVAATAHAFADGGVATVQNGVGNEEAIAEHVERVIRGTTFPAGKILEPGHVQWDVKGDTTLGPYEPKPASIGPIERSQTPARAAGCRRRRSRSARPPMAQGDLQRSHEPGRRADRVDPRPGVEVPTCGSSSPASSTKGRRSPPRRGSSSTPTRRT